MSDERNKRLGASEIGAVLGLSPYKTALDVWMEKTGRLVPPEPSIPMLAGTLLEPMVIDLFEKRMGLSVGHRQEKVFHGKYPFLSATLDGIADEGEAVVEAKTAGSSEGWGEEMTGEIPEVYLCQISQQLALAGYSVAFVPVLIGRADFRIYRVDRDLELEQMVLDRGIAFWTENVLKDIAPEPRTLEDLKKMFPASKAVTVEADQVIAQAVSDLRDIKKKIKDLSKIEKSTALSIQLTMGEADTLIYQGKEIATWKSSPRAGYTVAPTIVRTLKLKGE